ncbi:AAA domain-containing protein [Acetobacter ghanensis]|uniref:AAA domain-containing protein n=1 Tax=Acetobacter ghanensis TaxID=431306 RepID=UPI003D329FE6
MPALKAVLSYWRSALLDDAQMKISFDDKRNGGQSSFISVEAGVFRGGQLPENIVRALRQKHPNSSSLRPEDPIIVMAALRVLLGEVHHATGDTRQPTLYCMAALVSVQSDGRIFPADSTHPWLNRELLAPSDAETLIGKVSVMDEWLQLNPFSGGSLAATLEWADRFWNAVVGEKGLPKGYKFWGEVALQPTAASIGMKASQQQRRFYDALMDDDSLITPLLARYVNGAPEPKIVDASLGLSAASMPRGTVTAAYGMSLSQREAMAAFCALREGELLAVNGPPGTGKTTLLQGIVATELVSRALAGGEPAVIVGTSTNNQAVTNIIDAMTKAMATEDDRLWAKRWVPDANALGLYFPSMFKEKEALQAGYLIASPGRNLGTEEWKGFPERERNGDDARASLDFWVSRYSESFPPDMTCSAQGNSDDPQAQALNIVEHGIEDIRKRMSRIADVGKIIVEQAAGLYRLFEQSGYSCLDDVHAKIAAYDALIEERKPHEAHLKANLDEADVALEKLKAEELALQHSDSLLCTPLESRVIETERTVERLGKLAVALIAALPEDGFLAWFSFRKRWANVEKMVAESDQANFFRGLMQAQTRSRSEWMEAIQSMTDRAEEVLSDSRQKLQRERELLAVRKGVVESQIYVAAKSREAAQKALDQYVRECLSEVRHSRDTLVKLQQEMERKLRESGAIIERALPLSEWASIFGLSAEMLPWRLESWKGSIGVVEDFLDRTIRYALFQLALRYWEGRWVLEVHALQKALNDNDNRAYPFRVGERAIKAMYRRWAMLTPLFIVTTASLPKLSKCRVKEGDKFVERYMTDFFDLLIVDEAGQIAPYQMVPGMAFSRKAVVVGDVFQIEPVIMTSHVTDTGNARKAGVQDYFWDNDGPISPRVVTAAPGNGQLMGSVMRVAQTSTSYTSSDSPVPGIFLTEHRRCHRDIIEICNRLVYNGKLQPMTVEPSRKPPLPPLAWANVNGRTDRLGNSQRNLKEASAVARWVVEKSQEWEKFYQKPIHEIVAVVTPFSPQKDAIRAALRQHSREHPNRNFSKIMVGTVNAMQGAERDIVVFSPTCDRDVSTGFLDGKRSLLNVAISRAVHSFVVIGTMEIFERNPVSALGILGKALFSKGVELGDVTGNWVADDSLILRGRRISSVTEHHKLLDDAFENLKTGQEIIIVSPYLSQQAVTAVQTQTGIRKAAARGALVNVVTRDDEKTAPLRKMLEEAGARVLTIRRLHSKTLLTSAFIDEGSFNWLSVWRDSPEGANLDTSWVLTGEDAKRASREAIDELNERLKGQGNMPIGQYIFDSQKKNGMTEGTYQK